MDTAPLPAVPPELPPAAMAPATTHLRGVARGIEVVAGVLSAGLVVVGAGLVVLQLVASQIAPGSGLAAASGPTWGRALVQLGVGVAGECAVWARRHLAAGTRVWVATAVVAAAGAALWFTWWR